MDPHDHRSVGHAMALFHQQEDGPGVAFWHPRGARLWQTVEDDIRRRMAAAGYAAVRTPQLLARSLWEKSGHWETFAEAMFTVGDGERRLALKPMNCPGHVQIFNKAVHGRRDLPVRLAEFGQCHRNEPSGALSGLMRGRAFVQDDAHVFCTEEQVADEVARFCRLLGTVYADYGFESWHVGFSTRPAARAGSEAAWDRSEAMLEAAARTAGLDPVLQSGEGAFYGPKLEFVLEDSRGRRWQCGTIQLDRVLPERLGALFVDTDGVRRRPVMLHHAVLGSLERFIAVLLEHHRGRLPFWLAPDQVAVASIGPDQAAATEAAVQQLAAVGLRAVADVREESLSRKVIDARRLGIPVLAAVGPREAAAGTLALRRLFDGGKAEETPLYAAAAALAAEALPPSRRA